MKSSESERQLEIERILDKVWNSPKKALPKHDPNEKKRIKDEIAKQEKFYQLEAKRKDSMLFRYLGHIKVMGNEIIRLRKKLQKHTNFSSVDSFTQTPETTADKPTSSYPSSDEMASFNDLKQIKFVKEEVNRYKRFNFDRKKTIMNLTEEINKLLNEIDDKHKLINQYQRFEERTDDELTKVKENHQIFKNELSSLKMSLQNVSD